MTSWQVIEADCVKAMAAMGEASVDAIVTDPPYGLEFMGKEWDRPWAKDFTAIGDGNPLPDRQLHVNPRCKVCGGYQRGIKKPCGCDAPEWTDSQVAAVSRTNRVLQDWHHAWATEALRILKPGGHLLAFGGTRTYHRLACAIEDAGFEIRDTIAWMYGSGFPKSLDVSKAIDRQRLDNPDWQRVGAWLRARRLEAGVSAKGLCAAIGAHGEVNHGGAVSNWENGFSCPTWDQWEAIREALSFGSEMDAEVWRLNGRKGTPGNERSDRVVSEPGGNVFQPTQRVLNGGTPVLSEAERWQGWGTALKPAHEPIVVARKPLAGTVAANVLAHGTGALNVDECRIDGVKPVMERTSTVVAANAMAGESTGATSTGEMTTEGRWPANVVLDERAAAMLDEQTGDALHLAGNKGGTPRDLRNYSAGERGQTNRVDAMPASPMDESAGASRFFYVAKASSAERNAGLDGFEHQTRGSNFGMDGARPHTVEDYVYEAKDARNVHPTVKPIALMRWLVRLVTPPDGLVLDPFAGSGTTGCAAMLEGFDFIGIERESEYAAIARARIEWWAEHPEGVELVDRLNAERSRRAVADAGQLQMFGQVA